jgi:hypothetical protein
MNAMSILPGVVNELLGPGTRLHCPCGANFHASGVNSQDDSDGYLEGACPSCHSVRLYGRTGYSVGF